MMCQTYISEVKSQLVHNVWYAGIKCQSIWQYNSLGPETSVAVNNSLPSHYVWASFVLILSVDRWDGETSRDDVLDGDGDAR